MSVSETPTTEKYTAELVKDVSVLIPELIREELSLAKAEMSDRAKHAGVGAGLFGAGGLVAFFGAAALVGAAILGLAEALQPWLSALVVGLGLLAIAGLI